MFRPSQCVFVTLKRLVSEVSVQQAVDFDVSSFAIVHCRVQPYNTAIVVGIVAAPGKATRLPPWQRSTVHDSVFKHGVSLLTGIWGDTKEQTSELCQILPFATECPVSQAWQGDTTAVADLKGFPVYTLLLGRCHKFTMFAPQDLAHYQTALDEEWVPAVAGLHCLMPVWRPWTRSPIESRPGGDMNWAQVKCKRVDLAKWMAGVTQVVFWCGVSQQGFRAKQKSKAAKGKGKSKGASQHMPRTRESKR